MAVHLPGYTSQTHQRSILVAWSVVSVPGTQWVGSIIKWSSGGGSICRAVIIKFCSPSLKVDPTETGARERTAGQKSPRGTRSLSWSHWGEDMVTPA